MEIRHIIESNPYRKILQYPYELINFLQFMIDNVVNSYLEIGSAHGHIPLLMRDYFNFTKICACDLNDLLQGQPNIEFFCGDCYSDDFCQWRRNIGHIDMVMIDASHKRRYVRRDYEREKSLPHRFLAFHDIANKAYPKLSTFWKNEVKGNKLEFINTDPKARLIIQHAKDNAYMKKYRRKYGHACGIGICWEK
jgi:hypothetical protein